MTPERYNKISKLFDAALKRSPDERSQWLANACGNDRELCAEVEKLLLHQVEAEDFLERPAMQVAAQLLKQDRSRLHAGKQLKHYELLAPLGAGGMGEVWLARDTQLERKAALKLLPPEFTQDSERLQRFRREARAASALNHPNIITIYEIGEAEGLHFIATEFIDGVTLRQRLAEGRPGLRETITIIRQIAEALDTAHQADILHRDIKPENVMIRRDGLVKVLDFGLAKPAPLRSVDSGIRNEAGEDIATMLQASDGDPQLTMPGAVMGTPRYMSPEQARGLQVDARSDIFSLGVVFYEMVTGEPAFAGAFTAEVLTALLEKEPLPIRQFAPDVPDRLQEIISRMLLKTPDGRYENITSFTDDLSQLDIPASNDSAEMRALSVRSLNSNAPGKKTNEQQAQPTLPNQAQPVARSWLGWAIAALVLIVALSLGIWRWSGGTGHLFQAAPDATFTPLIGQAGRKNEAAFSPDESRIAFVWDGGRGAEVGSGAIYVKVLGSDEPPQRLTNSPNNESAPFWTPDGKYVAFVRGRPDKKVVIRMPAGGGPEQELAETYTSASWSLDGKKLAVSGAPLSAEGAGIFLVTPETGQRIRLTNPDSTWLDTYPRFSPDGKMIAFMREFGMSGSDIFVITLNSAGDGPGNEATLRQLTSEKSRLFGFDWTADGGELVYSAIRSGNRGLWRISAQGSTPVRVAINGKYPVNPEISPKGNKLIWTELSTDANLWMYQGAGFSGREVPDKFGAPVRLPASSLYDDQGPSFSPDGKMFVFSSERTGAAELWLCDTAGKTVARQLTRGGLAGSPRWSYDGNWIAFDSFSNGDGDVYVMSATGEGTWRRLTFEKTTENLPAWSRDGQWIYFKSNRTGINQIFKMPSAGGPAKQITFNGGFEGFESPDGKLFYYTKGRAGEGIYSVPADGGEEKLVPDLKGAGYWRSWTVVNEGVCFTAKDGEAQWAIRFFNFATRRTTSLVTLTDAPLWWSAGLALSMDGRRMLYAHLEQPYDELMLMEQFR